MKIFLARHTEGTIQADGKKLYEEDFYINQHRPPQARQGFFHCFAYGDCLWRGKYQFQRSRSELKLCDHGNEWWSFEFILEGDAEFICDKIHYKVCAGDILIMRPETQIALRTGPSGFLRKKCILLESPLLKYICETGSLAGINHIHPHDSLRLTNIYNTIKEIIVRQDKYCQQDIGAQAYALLSELNHLAMPQQYPAPLRCALDIIDANPYQDYSLYSLSARCKVSISTLSRLFKHHLNTSPVNYIIDRRLEQARLLLNISNITVKEVAEKCGYKSESFLSRSFKNKFGISPTKFRRFK